MIKDEKGPIMAWTTPTLVEICIGDGRRLGEREITGARHRACAQRNASNAHEEYATAHQKAPARRTGNDSSTRSRLIAWNNGAAGATCQSLARLNRAISRLLCTTNSRWLAHR